MSTRAEPVERRLGDAAGRRPRPSGPRTISTGLVAPAATISPASSSSRLPRRATSASRTPSRASASAMPRPMPMLAPVTSAVLPLSPRSMPCLACVCRDQLWPCAREGSIEFAPPLSARKSRQQLREPGVRSQSRSEIPLYARCAPAHVSGCAPHQRRQNDGAGGEHESPRRPLTKLSGKGCSSSGANSNAARRRSRSRTRAGHARRGPAPRHRRGPWRPSSPTARGRPSRAAASRGGIPPGNGRSRPGRTAPPAARCPSAAPKATQFMSGTDCLARA